MVYKRPPYLASATGFGNDDAAFLARNGFNVVRLGVIYGAVEPSPGVYDDAYIAQIAATVRALSSHGIYTLLDFHQDQYNERFHGEGFPEWAVHDDGLPNTPDFGFPGNYVQQPVVQHAFDHFWADSPGPGACTAVFVPALQYPHGYHARVRGAKVISRHGAGLLELASRRGAKSVTVTVTPTRRGHTGARRATGAGSLRVGGATCP